jgi:hypothetical protein
LKGSVQRVKRTFVAVVLAVVFVLALAAPALAQAIFHTATYEMEGVIDFRKQAGHFCNTGAEVKQVIAGSGKMDKVQTITQVQGKITMADDNNWVAGATPLTVTTVWKLCTPPKYTYNDPDDPFAANSDGTNGDDIPVDLPSLYPPALGVLAAVLPGTGNNMPASWNQSLGLWQQGYNVRQLAAIFGWDAVSEQYWAVQVQADPGFSGNLHQNGEAAYGAFWGNGSIAAFDAGWTAYPFNHDHRFRWEENKAATYVVPSVGAKYVGDYFNMEQMARTSQGTLKRHIDISSPWSHGYLYEDMSVVGKSQITEAVKMVNLPAGADVPKDWWKLF